MHDIEERNKMGSLLKDLEDKREKERLLNNKLFYNKMKKLRQMIDRRAKEKLIRMQEMENEACLSKKTSFSSFYNLEE